LYRCATEITDDTVRRAIGEHNDDPEAVLGMFRNFIQLCFGNSHRLFGSRCTCKFDKIDFIIDCIQGLRLISYPRNRGKGYALRIGVLASRGGLVLLSDADLSTPIEELEILRPRIVSESFQIAIGSRALPLSQIARAQPRWRRGMGRLFNRLVKALVIDDFQDTQCGFKLFTDEAARLLFGAARVERFAYDVEILALAKNHGYRVAEVPVKWTNSVDSRVRPVRDSLQMLADLVKIRLAFASAKGRRESTPLESLEASKSVTP